MYELCSTNKPTLPLCFEKNKHCIPTWEPHYIWDTVVVSWFELVLLDVGQDSSSSLLEQSVLKENITSSVCLNRTNMQQTLRTQGFDLVKVLPSMHQKCWQATSSKQFKWGRCSALTNRKCLFLLTELISIYWKQSWYAILVKFPQQICNLALILCCIYSICFLSERKPWIFLVIYRILLQIKSLDSRHMMHNLTANVWIRAGLVSFIEQEVQGFASLWRSQNLSKKTLQKEEINLEHTGSPQKTQRLYIEGCSTC